MDFPPLKCWSFAYTYEGARYSLEIVAPTQDEAEGRIKALVGATCEGSIGPIDRADEETLALSA